MVDYEKLYYKMYIATTRALDILKVAQTECEDMYLEMSENKTNEDNVLYFSDYENFEPTEIVKEEDDDGFLDFVSEDDDYEVFDLESDE